MAHAAGEAKAPWWVPKTGQRAAGSMVLICAGVSVWVAYLFFPPRGEGLIPWWVPIAVSTLTTIWLAAGWAYLRRAAAVTRAGQHR